jgi:mannose-6-phosphate isomerase-like protein (cupin superfamily)|tara:strand:+ start:116 stop:481 length:366 start_codon:yes stop_codon:yes gene_type:complete
MESLNDFTVMKPWGHEIRFAENDKYLGKILYIKQGHRLSRQYHELKDETIFVERGTLILELGSPDVSSFERKTLRYGERFRILPGIIHRFCAPEDSSVTLIEVSTPEINDVVRLEDDYKRA